MDVIDHHGTLQVQVPPSRRLRLLAALALLASLAGPALMLALPVRPDRVWLPLLAGETAVALGCAMALQRLMRTEVLQIGLFVRTGQDQGSVMVRSSDLLAVGKDEPPRRRSRAGLAAAFGAGPGRLRLHTSRGDFLFGAALTDDDLTRLVWRLTPICRDNLRPRGHASRHHHK